MSSELLKSKYLSRRQTAGEDAEPRSRSIIRRNPVPINIPENLNYSKVSEGNYSRVTNAESREHYQRTANAAYIGGINSSGNAEIYRSRLTLSGASTAWSLVDTIDNVIDIAIAFEGSYKTIESKVQFKTVGKPWILYVDNSNRLFAKKFNGMPVELGTGISKVDAVMGLEPETSGIASQGFIVIFCAVSGALLYRQYDAIEDEWNAVVAVVDVDTDENITDALDVTINRTWDYKLVILWQTSAGIFQQTTKTEATGFANAEHIDLGSIKVNTEIIEPISQAGYNEENIALDNAAINTVVYPTDAPVIQLVQNENDGLGN